MNKCIKCGSLEIDKGRMRVENGFMEINYHSNNKKRFRSGADLDAFVCINCGYTELYSNVEHIKQTSKGRDYFV